MTTDSPQSGRAPREPGPIGQLARLFLVQLLAIIAVAAVIAVVFTATGRGTGHLRAGAGRSGTAAAASTTATSATTTTATSATTTSGGADPTTAAPPSASAVPAPAATVPSTSPTAAPTTSAGNDRPKVDVLNQSSAAGAAAHAADDVTALGWQVGRIDNFVGNVRATTVYYPPGLQTQAKDLAKALPGPQRVLPGFSTLSSTRLSLILVS